MKTITTILLVCFGMLISGVQAQSTEEFTAWPAGTVFEKNQIELNTNRRGGTLEATNSTSNLAIDPYNCTNGLVYILTNVASSNGNITGLFSYNLGTGTQTLIKYPLLTNTSSSQFVNALGYNVLDNFLYGLNVGTNNLVKIDSQGGLEFLPLTGMSMQGNFSSGDINENGVMYMYGQNSFVSVNLNPSAPDYLVATTLLNYSSTIFDITFSPIDNNIYMMTSNSARRLLRYNVTTNTITNLGAITGLESETTNSFGTAFMDSLGNMYVSNNSSGNIYKITSPQTGGLSATFFTSITGNPGDGARCPNQVIAPNAIADQTCSTADANIDINVAQNDLEGTNALDINSIQLIDPLTSNPSTSVTISGQGTFTVATSGIVTFTPLASFTQATVQYTIADIAGFRSNPATITVNGSNADAPSGDSTQEFCSSDEPTIANLVASGTSVQWYASQTSNVALPSSTILIDQTVYYAALSTTAGCVSTNRLAVTVVLNDDIVLLTPATTACSDDRNTYIISANFSGNGPFTAVGTGAPGLFSDNGDGTSTWTSDAINYLVTNYSVDISDSNDCNTITVTGNSPQDCLTIPFDCDNGLSYILTNSGTSTSNFVTGLYSLNLETNVATLIKDPLIPSTSTRRFINGIGYNRMDNLLYGILQGTNNIVRIDAAGNIDYLTITGNFTIGDYSSGDIDQNGNLYLYGENKFVSINVNSNSPNYLVANNLLTFSININDLAFSPVDNNIYMVTSAASPQLFRYNTLTNTISNLGSITGLSSETTTSYGTAFMDNMGNMYIANNGSGTIYKISDPDAGGLAATFYSASTAGLNPGDGARCPNQVIFPVANNINECAVADATTIIDISVFSSEGTFPLDFTTLQLLNPTTLTPTNTVTIPGQGTFSVNGSGEVSFVSFSTFTEAVVSYTIADTMGNISEPATITITSNTAVAPTGDAVQTFCIADQPTVADLVANGSNIQWFESENSTTALDPSTPLIDQAIYYASQTTGAECESTDRLAVTVSLIDGEAPTGNQAQVFCISDQPTVANLTANGENIQWFASATSNTPLSLDTPLIDQGVYYASQTVTSGCESSERLEVTVTLTPASEAPIGETSQTFCESDNPTIADLNVSGEMIQWYESLTSTTPLDPTTPLIDQTTYYATQMVISGCESLSRLEVTVTLNPPSEVPLGETTQQFCESENPTVADLEAIGESILWYDSATSTTPLDTATLLIDQNIYYASQTNSTGCESIDRLEVIVSITPITEAPQGEADQTFCDSENPTIADLVATGTNIQWFDSLSSTTPLDPATVLIDQAVYYASQSNDLGCGSERLQVTVTLTSDVILTSNVETTCNEQGTSYTLTITVTGVAPFTATGVGSPGVFTENTDGSYTWVSGPLNYQANYDIQIQDANACNTLDISGDAPEDCFTPFECADGLVYILTNTPSSNGNITALYSFDINTNTLNLIKDPLIEDASTSQFVNGIGYNVLDNFIYGVQQNTDQMLKINEFGEIDFLTITGVFNVGSYSSGDIDENGTMYLYGQNKFVAVNLDPSDPNYLQASTLLNYSTTVNDVAFSPVDNNLYMITSNGANSLLRFNTLTNTVDELGTVTGLGNETSNSYGTAFMDIAGNMYIANNSSGNLYKIDSPQNGGLVATLYSNALGGLNPGDGARCPNQSINPFAADDQVCLVENETIIIPVTANDASGTFPLDLSSVQLIDPVTSAPTSSVTISGQGTFTVNTSGTVTFVAVATFTGTSVDYTVSDTMGTQTNPATIVVTLNTTQAPTGSSNQIFCESDNPTIADLSANGENIQWYESATATTPLDITTALVNQSTYYATQTTIDGCESIDRLEVTVTINADIELIGAESASCDASGLTYTITATFNGTSPFTANGTGAPGTFTENTDGTSTWVSEGIDVTVNYGISFQDVNACNTIILNGNAPNCCTFEVTCPTFQGTTVECYDEIPTTTFYTVAEFEALGNGDGTIGDTSCGVIEITASNSEDTGECAQSVIRTFTITAYEDTNQNGVRDADETTVLNSQQCTQTILVNDRTAPIVLNDLSDISVTCDSIPEVPTLNFDECSTTTITSFVETNEFDPNADQYPIIWTWEFEDACGNIGTATQTVLVSVTVSTTFVSNDLCQDIAPLDLFDELPSSTDMTGTWEVISGNTTLNGSIFDQSNADFGDYTFTYAEPVSGQCPNVYEVTITVIDCVVLPCGEEDVIISTTVTPNNDQYNEFFEVTGVETCGFVTELQIFNRWGAKIYENFNYQNDWNGQVSKGSIGNSDKVPTGTYYYIINLRNSGIEPFAGPIYVATK